MGRSPLQAPKAQLMLWLLLSTLFHVCYGKESSLRGLDAEAFGRRSAVPGLFVVGFCTPSYELCQELKTELLSAAESLSESANVDVYEFDCSEDEAFCLSLDVTSFPTIRIFDQQQWTRYRGLPKSAGVVSHVLKRVMGPVIELNDQRFNALKTLEMPLLVLTPGPEPSTLDMMTSLAEQHLSDRFIVGVATDSTSAGTESPFITVHNALDETTPTYQGPFESDALLQFADSVSAPLIKKFDAFTLRNSMESGVPVAILFSADEAERKLLSNSIASVAMKYRGRLNFAAVHAEKQSYFLKHVGLTTDDLPAFTIQTAKETFKFDRKSEITADAIGRFIEQKLPS